MEIPGPGLPDASGATGSGTGSMAARAAGGLVGAVRSRPGAAGAARHRGNREIDDPHVRRSPAPRGRRRERERASPPGPRPGPAPQRPAGTRGTRNHAPARTTTPAAAPAAAKSALRVARGAVEIVGSLVRLGPARPRPARRGASASLRRRSATSGRPAAQGVVARSMSKPAPVGTNARSCVGEGAAGRRATLRVLGERPLEDRVEAAGEAVDRRREERRGRRHVLVHQRERALSVERGLAGEELVREDGERVAVGRGGGRLALGLLGRHVDRRPDDHPRRGEAGRALQHLRDAEVGEGEAVVPADQDVRRLDVAVEDPRLVRGVERVAQLADPGDGLREGDRRADHPVAERSPFEVRHHEVRQALFVAVVVDREDVRVVERGDEPGLVVEALPEVAVPSVAARITFTATVRPRRSSVGPPDLGHPPLPEELLETVAAEPLSLLRHSSTSREARAPSREEQTIPARRPFTHRPSIRI